MNPLAIHFVDYWARIFGARPTVSPWKKAAGLPLYLRRSYEIDQAAILGSTYLLVQDKRRTEIAPADLEKQLSIVQKSAGLPIVYVRAAISSRQRDLLIRRGIQFVVPGNQLYMPSLGMDLRERFRSAKEPRPTIGPATQASLLRLLRDRTYGPLTPAELARDLGFTPMTATRVFNELRDLEVGEHESRPKRRTLTFRLTGKALWEKVLPSLRSPVRSTHAFNAPNRSLRLPMAGLTALAHYTSLAEPRIPAVAVGPRQWKVIRSELNTVSTGDDAAELQVWTYDPSLVGGSGVVDRLSLYLTLRDDPDERTQAALRAMLEDVRW